MLLQPWIKQGSLKQSQRAAQGSAQPSSQPSKQAQLWLPQHSRTLTLSRPLQTHSLLSQLSSCETSITGCLRWLSQRLRALCLTHLMSMASLTHSCAHGQDRSSQQGLSNVQVGPSHPQSAVDASADSISQAAAGVTNPRPDTHLSLTEMLLLEEDSLAESKATPLLQHRVSMATNITDAFPLSPSSSASPLHSDRSMRGSPDHPRPADSASAQQAESSGVGFGGWPGPAPEWISVVMRGKHGGNREAFIQYHVPEGLVYVNGTNLSLKASLCLPALGALCCA